MGDLAKIEVKTALLHLYCKKKIGTTENASVIHYHLQFNHGDLVHQQEQDHLNSVFFP
jgi:hypothetical protein